MEGYLLLLWSSQFPTDSKNGRGDLPRCNTNWLPLEWLWIISLNQSQTEYELTGDTETKERPEYRATIICFTKALIFIWVLLH